MISLLESIFISELIKNREADKKNQSRRNEQV